MRLNLKNVNVEVEPGEISDLDVEWLNNLNKVVMTLKRMLFLMWMTLRLMKN